MKTILIFRFTDSNWEKDSLSSPNATLSMLNVAIAWGYFAAGRAEIIIDFCGTVVVPGPAADPPSVHS